MSGVLLRTMLEKGYEIYQLPDDTWAALIAAGHFVSKFYRKTPVAPAITSGSAASSVSVIDDYYSP